MLRTVRTGLQFGYISAGMYPTGLDINDETGALKLGQPVPESNLASERKKCGPAADASVNPMLLAVMIFPGKRILGFLPARHAKLPGGQ